MNKLIKLSNILKNLGHIEHGAGILRLARESDAAYIRVAEEVISDLEGKIISGEIYIGDGPGVFISVGTTVNVDLSGISDYTKDTLGILLKVFDPKLGKADFVAGVDLGLVSFIHRGKITASA